MLVVDSVTVGSALVTGVVLVIAAVGLGEEDDTATEEDDTAAEEVATPATVVGRSSSTP